MSTLFTQSRSDHPRTSSRILRHRSQPCDKHTSAFTTLIDAISASRKLGLSPLSLETGAVNGLIPHHWIDGQIRFDPLELNRWMREHLDAIRSAEGRIDLQDGQ